MQNGGIHRDDFKIYKKLDLRRGVMQQTTLKEKHTSRSSTIHGRIKKKGSRKGGSFNPHQVHDIKKALDKIQDASHTTSPRNFITDDPRLKKILKHKSHLHKQKNQFDTLVSNENNIETDTPIKSQNHVIIKKDIGVLKIGKDSACGSGEGETIMFDLYNYFQSPISSQERENAGLRSCVPVFVPTTDIALSPQLKNKISVTKDFAARKMSASFQPFVKGFLLADLGEKEYMLMQMDKMYQAKFALAMLYSIVFGQFDSHRKKTPQNRIRAIILI